MDLNKAEELALYHIAIHCPEYSFKFDESATCLGKCWYRKKLITLSKHWTSSLSHTEVLDTILHEIAHALAFKDGHTGHGHIWKQHAIALGATPSATARTGIKRHQIKEPLYKLMFNDEVIHGYYRKPSANIYNKLPYMYATGRKYETMGKLYIVGQESQLKKLYDAGITFTGLAKKCKHCKKNNTAWKITPDYTWLHECGNETEE